MQQDLQRVWRRCRGSVLYYEAPQTERTRLPWSQSLLNTRPDALTRGPDRLCETEEHASGAYSSAPGILDAERQGNRRVKPAELRSADEKLLNRVIMYYLPTWFDDAREDGRRRIRRG